MDNRHDWIESQKCKKKLSSVGISAAPRSTRGLILDCDEGYSIELEERKGGRSGAPAPIRTVVSIFSISPTGSSQEVLCDKTETLVVQAEQFRVPGRVPVPVLLRSHHRELRSGLLTRARPQKMGVHFRNSSSNTSVVIGKRTVKVDTPV